MADAVGQGGYDGFDPRALRPEGNGTNNVFVNVYQSKATADVTVGNFSLPTMMSIAREHWYLDSECAGYHQNSWKCVYQVEPTSNVTSGRPELLLGGQAAAWGEGLAAHDFDAYVWRGAAAVAERLWSPRNTTDVADALERMGDQM